VKARDKVEFVAALTAQLPALRRYATALAGTTAAADDLVQDCLERALAQADRLQDMNRIGGWLRSILHNLYIDDVRRRGRQGITIDAGTADDHGALAGPAPDPAAGLDLARALGTLSVEHRQILLLAGLEGLNYREIAAELGIPMGTVMSRLARARERLRHALDGGSAGRPPAAGDDAP
jgi:RNA polymerase sigma-70 factor (ECF subfamily)